MLHSANSFTPSAGRHQAGAALVVALILLVALTLMALASMNTASLDLMMAGNEQYTSRAFASAEAGVANAIKNAPFDGSADFSQPSTATLDDDSYKYTVTRPNGNQTLSQMPPNFSQGASGWGILPFRITSTGSSYKGAQDTLVQDVYKVSRLGNTVGCQLNCAVDPKLGN